MKLAFVDTETTGLDPARHDMWEVAVITIDDRQPADTLSEWAWQIHPNLRAADPAALRIGDYYGRTPAGPWTTRRLTCPPWLPGDDPLATRDVIASTLAAELAGATIVGINPAFDAAFIGAFLRAHGQQEAWDYHLIDVANLAAGWLLGSSDIHVEHVIPWKSDRLSEKCGVEPPTGAERHTALGDARWVQRWYTRLTEEARP